MAKTIEANPPSDKEDLSQTRLSWKKKLLFSTITFIIFLSILELALRVLDLPPTLRQDEGLIQRVDNALNMQYRPGWEGYFAGARVRINSAGWRGKEFSAAKPPNTVRIIGLGDSFTFGKAAEEEDIYLTQLERMLNEQGGKNYETINTGHDGINTFQEFRYFKERNMLGLSPDVVVLGFTIANDAEIDFYNNRFILQNKLRDESIILDITESRSFGNLAKSLRIAKVLERGANWLNKDLITKESFKLKLRTYDDEFEAWQSCRNSLLGLSDLLGQNHVPLIVAIFPDWTREEDQTYEDYPQEFKEIHNKVKNVFAGRSGVAVLDLIDDLAATGRTVKELKIPIDGHPNRIWHEVAARKIAEAIKARGL